jgi:class 3 adenylate cyclase
MPCAILIADMAGFSALCERDGDLAGLKAARRFHEIGRSLTEGHAGEFVKAWADNFMAAFPTVRHALGAAECLVALVPASVGIGWGDPIREPDDLWGVEVNRASRLGEDIAGEGEVLLTDAAKAALAAAGCVKRRKDVGPMTSGAGHGETGAGAKAAHDG